MQKLKIQSIITSSLSPLHYRNNSAQPLPLPQLSHLHPIILTTYNPNSLYTGGALIFCGSTALVSCPLDFAPVFCLQIIPALHYTVSVRGPSLREGGKAYASSLHTIRSRCAIGPVLATHAILRNTSLARTQLLCGDLTTVCLAILIREAAHASFVAAATARTADAAHGAAGLWIGVSCSI